MNCFLSAKKSGTMDGHFFFPIFHQKSKHYMLIKAKKGSKKKKKMSVHCSIFG
jgi:hypothetical protein